MEDQRQHRQQQQQQRQQQHHLEIPSIFTALPTASHCHSSVGTTTGGGMIPTFNFGLMGTQCWQSVDKLWQSTVCCSCNPPTQSHSSSNFKRKQQTCRRLYFTSWLLGIVFVMATNCYSFSQSNNQPSKLCLWMSMVLSVVTGLSHSLIVSREQRFASRKNWILFRFVLSIIGIAVSCCVTAVGVLIADVSHGVFVLLGFMAIVCYWITFACLCKRLHWEYKRNFVGHCSDNDMGRRERNGVSRGRSNHVTSSRHGHISTINNTSPLDTVESTDIVYNDNFDCLESSQTQQQTFRLNNRLVSFNTSASSNNHWNISSIRLPILTIPTYDDVISDMQVTSLPPPPKYTEHSETNHTASDNNSNAESHINHTCSNEELTGDCHSPDASPPQYSEATDSHNNEINLHEERSRDCHRVEESPPQYSEHNIM